MVLRRLSAAVCIVMYDSRVGDDDRIMRGRKWNYREAPRCTSSGRGTLTRSVKAAHPSGHIAYALLGHRGAAVLGQAVTLLKALVSGVARGMARRYFEGSMDELRFTGERIHDALTRPGEGRKRRHVVAASSRRRERSRPHGALRWPTPSVS